MDLTLKKLYILLPVCTLILLTGCNGRGLQPSDDMNASTGNVNYKSYDNEAFKSVKPSVMNTIPPEISDKSSKEYGASSVNTLTIQDIKKYLTMKKSHLMNLIGNDYETGTESLMETHMIFPTIIDRKRGISFLYPNDEDDVIPCSVTINEETNLGDSILKGIKSGMLFKDIKEKLGETDVAKTWVSYEDIIAYKLDYTFDDLVFSFVSYEESGIYSELYISLLPDNKSSNHSDPDFIDEELIGIGKIQLSDSDFEITYNNIQINQKTKVYDIIKILGWPEDYDDNNRGYISRNASCRRWNLCYPDYSNPEIRFIVLSERKYEGEEVKDSNSYIVGVYLENISTSRGLSVGDNLDDVLRLYGKPDSIDKDGGADDDWYILSYSFDEMNLDITISKNTKKVTAVFVDYQMDKADKEQGLE